MPDEPLYDPERMVFEELDLTDAHSIKEYLGHPATNALYEDFGHEFRSLTPDDQRLEIETALGNYQTWRAEVAAGIETEPEGSLLRESLSQLLERLEDFIGLARLRLLELDDEE